jgi:hypothetical protein
VDEQKYAPPLHIEFQFLSAIPFILHKKTMPRLLMVALVLLISSSAIGQEWKKFTDTAGNFTASYPTNWVNKIKAGNRVFFTSPSDGSNDKFYENINIAVSYNKAYASSTLGEFFPDVTTQISASFNDFKEESLRYFKWNNRDAAELIYSGYNKADESVKVRCTQWFCLYNSKLYLATFVADAAAGTHNATARKIMGGIIFR